PSVRDHEAQIVFDGRDFNISVTDDGEVQINGKKKRRSRIFHNDRILIGNVELFFSVYDEAHTDQGLSETKKVAELAGMRKLSDVSRRLMEIRLLGEQLEALLDAVIEVTHADKGFVLLLEDGRGRVAAGRHVHKENLPDEAQQLSDSIIREVVESRRP